VNACTIIARNYLPHARVLADSFLEHHPHGTFTALVIDDAGHGDLADEPFAVLSPYDIGLERAEVHRMALIYDVKEFATSLKPALLARLLEDSDEVAYFDPDIEVFASLDDLGELAAQHGIVLTPHTTVPLPRDDLLPSEEMLLRAGIYNLGFIAVGRKGRPFLEWWGERLRRDCLVAVEDGLFVDQRWVDFVPALFDHVVTRDTSCNVAYWNLSHRELVLRDGRWEVDGNPLRFFHYSGFSPDRMHMLSAHMGSAPRILPGDAPDLRQLCDTYADRLRVHGYGADADESYRFDALPNGLAIDSRVRRDIRQAMVTAERDGEPAAPDPFGEVEQFLDWLGDPVGHAGLPRYLAALYRRRGDLRHAYPDPAGSDRSGYLDWAATVGREQADIPRAALERALPRQGVTVRAPSRTERMESALRGASQRHTWLSPLATAYRALRGSDRRMTGTLEATEPTPLVAVPTFPPLPGINLVGYLRAELGVGEAARRLARGLEAGRIPHTTTAYGHTQSRQQHAFARRGGLAIYDTNVICVNADQLPSFRREAGPALFEDRYTIGMWFWEVDRFPESLHEAFELVDEVWVASDFVAEAVSAETSKPVHVVPLPVEAPTPTALKRADVGLPDGFVFLFSFDFLSVAERKNPLGVVEAFERAFETEGPSLVIKTINGHLDPDALEHLRRRTAGHDDIRVVDGYVSSAERDALTELCDCYVSLHRSEGYGLTMAEAMAVAKPVIATGYSGNLAFMNEENSLLVPYHPARIPLGCDPYPASAHWAEPDIDAAAELMRYVYENQEEARELGRRAQEDVLRRCGPLRTGRFVALRLGEVRAERTTLAHDPSRTSAPPGSTLVGGRRPVRLTRRLLQRLLWPYLEQRRAFDAAVADALRAHESFTASEGAPGEAQVTELARSNAAAAQDPEPPPLRDLA
jgi:glycosyltransferase involved in cell wall biosynthesis